jgi:glycosyltransferase involved in cell wall biosynthesis
MATHERPELLARTLDSIARQRPPFEFEVIVVDDGSESPEIQRIVTARGYGYFRIDREPGYRNPGPARNFGYRVARGEVVICQSDDVVHRSADCIAKLVKLVANDNFVIATVFNGDIDDCELPNDVYTSPQKPSPLFFLGAIQRRHIYAIGGNDEDFTEPGYDDNYFADCLIQGLGLTPLFTDEVVGIHQKHERPRLVGAYRHMRAIYERKFAYSKAKGVWVAIGGAWSMDRSTV